ncbi:helix-turn-helix domain-containing protein [Kamptonema formosum]|uniref:helix-turn-helix domain-containing protein n=1 Tax=Kamptonema formosum TaxID=331992 RepID=UPI00034C9870|nr:AraC family transcriptional regulator [Oscillatoria sp. PCC 10802]
MGACNPLEGSGYSQQRFAPQPIAHLDQELALPDMAEVAGMSQYYFCRLFSQSMGVAPYQYVIQQRVERAKGLLKERRLPLADVALACGESQPKSLYQTLPPAHRHHPQGLSGKVKDRSFRSCRRYRRQKLISCYPVK